MSGENGNAHGVPLGFSDATACFDGAEILAEVSAFLQRYIHVSPEQARILAVLAAHTYAMLCWTTTPYLAISQP